MTNALTVEKLKSLPFVFSMHLNMGKEHARIEQNTEYGLSISTVSRKPGHRIVSRVLKAFRLPDDYEADLMSTDLDTVLAEFVGLYNAAEPTDDPEDEA